MASNAQLVADCYEPNWPLIWRMLWFRYAPEWLQLLCSSDLRDAHKSDEVWERMSDGGQS